MKTTVRKELLIGACVLASLAILFFGIDFLKGINVFQATNYYYASYTNVNGLAVSAPVTVNGFKVGQVREIKYQYDNPDHVKVEIALDNELKLPVGSKAVLSTDMLGTSTIVLQLAAGNKMYSPGQELEGVQARGLMDGITDGVLPAVEGVMPKVDTLLTTTNGLLADPALTASIKRLDAITANLEATTINLNRVSAQLPAIATDAKTITGSFVSTSQNLNTFSGQLQQMPIDSLVCQLEATTRNLRILTEQLNSDRSSLGLMMHDPALYNNLNNTVRSLDSLFVDIKARPKRYINIKLL